MESLRRLRDEVTNKKWLPVWMRVATALVLLGIEIYISICPIDHRNKPELIEAAINATNSTARWAGEGNESIATAVLRKAKKDRTIGQPLSRTKARAEDSLSNLGLSVGKQLRLLSHFPSSGGPDLILKSLILITVNAVSAAKHNKELLEKFQVDMVLFRTSMVINIAFGIWRALKANDILSAASAVRPGRIERFARWIGILRGRTRQSLLLEQACWVACSSLGFFGKAIWDGYRAQRRSKMKRLCGNVQAVVRRIWFLGAESFVVSRFAKTTKNGNVRFTELRARRLWSKIRRKKDPHQDSRLVSELMPREDYLQQRKQELIDVRDHLANNIASVYR